MNSRCCLSSFDKERFDPVLDSFGLDPDRCNVERIGSGHINDSFKADSGIDGIYLLQRINTNVFRDIPGLMRNIETVTSHIGEKIREGDPAAAGMDSLRLIRTTGGLSLIHI
jgi:hypothetical protein